jgi:hypothetical protein
MCRVVGFYVLLARLWHIPCHKNINMKKIMFAMAFMSFAILATCQTTPAQKVVKTDTKVDSARARLDRAKAANAEASKAYIADTKRQIEANEKEIARLKSTMVKPRSSPQNDAVKKKIDQLEDRNDDLRGKPGQ